MFNTNIFAHFQFLSFFPFFLRCSAAKIKNHTIFKIFWPTNLQILSHFYWIIISLYCWLVFNNFKVFINYGLNFLLKREHAITNKSNDLISIQMAKLPVHAVRKLLTVKPHQTMQKSAKHSVKHFSCSHDIICLFTGSFWNYNVLNFKLHASRLFTTPEVPSKNDAQNVLSRILFHVQDVKQHLVLITIINKLR